MAESLFEKLGGESRLARDRRHVYRPRFRRSHDRLFFPQCGPSAY